MNSLLWVTTAAATVVAAAVAAATLIVFCVKCIMGKSAEEHMNQRNVVGVFVCIYFNFNIGQPSTVHQSSTAKAFVKSKLWFCCEWIIFSWNDHLKFADCLELFQGWDIKQHTSDNNQKINFLRSGCVFSIPIIRLRRRQHSRLLWLLLISLVATDFRKFSNRI